MQWLLKKEFAKQIKSANIKGKNSNRRCFERKLETKTKSEGCLFMEPFNIHIVHNNQQLTLTILPTADYYKIIYYGGIVAGIRKSGDDWLVMEEQEIEPGDLPMYDEKKGLSEEPALELNLLQINQIAVQIEEHKSKIEGYEI